MNKVFSIVLLLLVPLCSSSETANPSPPDLCGGEVEAVKSLEDYSLPVPQTKTKEDMAQAVEAKVAQWSAVVVGGTGQTGKYLVKQLAEAPEVSKVGVVVRKELTKEQLDQKFGLQEAALQKIKQSVVDFDKLEDYKQAFEGYDKGFCTLGTTRSKAGSAEAFRKVDYDYVFKSAQLMKEGGVKHFSLMTSQGSDKNSMFLYPRTKGEIEEAVKGFGFERFSIFRPGLLLCDREETRPTEWVLQKIYPNWMLPQNWKATETSDVAKAILTNALRAPAAPVEEYSTAQIRLLEVGKV